METIGDRIAVAMRGAGLDQPALAKRIGISKQAMSSILTGKTKSPTAENVFKIAHATGFEAEWLVTGKGPMTHREAASERLDLHGLPSSTKAALRAVLDSLSRQDDDDMMCG